ncbi:TPA: hypothetical protein NPP60_004937 [Klebsiella variicola subsp. variicola]|nr:hypothetical protein [Klebsiella variicola subsp. variicola]
MNQVKFGLIAAGIAAVFAFGPGVYQRLDAIKVPKPGSESTALGSPTKEVPEYLQASIYADDWEGTIFEGAVMQITPDTFPILYNRLGEDMAAEANKGVFSAAYRVIRVPECDGVDYAGISEKATPDDLRFFVHCNNGKMWKFSEIELVDNDGEWLTKENAPRADRVYTGWQKTRGPRIQPKVE